MLDSGPPTRGWGVTRNQDKPWTLDELVAIKREIESVGLTWEAIENFDPLHWTDTLLDGPTKHAQMQSLKRTIQTVGRAGIPIMGYDFSIAGVWGWTKGPFGHSQRHGVEHSLRSRRTTGPLGASQRHRVVAARRVVSARNPAGGRRVRRAYGAASRRSAHDEFARLGS